MKNRLFTVQKGTTLLELVVAVAIFIVVMTAAMNIFSMIVEGQRSALAAQTIQDNMRFAMEVMSKELRMAKNVSEDSSCNGANGWGAGINATNRVYNINVQGDRLYFKNKNDECVTYWLDVPSGQLQIIRKKVGVYTKQGSTTPDELLVSNLKFFVNDETITRDPLLPGIQPLVMLTMRVEAKGKTLHRQIVQLETSISSRSYQ
jgi:type II secretory pathway pseudopilin PulG